jgi:hypothetical protein
MQRSLKRSVSQNFSTSVDRASPRAARGGLGFPQKIQNERQQFPKTLPGKPLGRKKPKSNSLAPQWGSTILASSHPQHVEHQWVAAV